VRKRVGLALLALAIVAVVATAWSRLARRPFPADTTPEGAYLRIGLAVTEDHPRDAFAYLETEAQWASFTIKDLRARACARIRAAYPERERDALLAAYAREAEAPDGSDVFAMIAREKGWIARLRKDTSGVHEVLVQGERATVVTARGTRYPFRLRENGIWGLTIFTAELVAESERAARDLAVVEKTAADYERAGR
jgi:hypothetical protein